MIPEWKSQDFGRIGVLRSLVDPPSFHGLRWSGTCRRRCASSEPWRFDHLHRRRPLHGAGVLPGLSGLQSLGKDDYRLVLVLRGSVPLGCGPGNRSSSEWSNRPADRRLRHFRASPCRSDSGGASRRRHPACCRDHDFRHRRLIFPIPVGLAEAVGDLRPVNGHRLPKRCFKLVWGAGAAAGVWRVSRSRESQGHRAANRWPKRRPGSTRTPSTWLQLQLCSSHYLLVRQKAPTELRGRHLASFGSGDYDRNARAEECYSPESPRPRAPRVREGGAPVLLTAAAGCRLQHQRRYPD
jgi:hypothetical protein